MFVSEEQAPAPASSSPSSVVADICEYLTAAIVSECRDRLPEVALAYGGLGQIEGRAAAIAMIESAARKASARLVGRIDAKLEPDSTHLLLIA